MGTDGPGSREQIGDKVKEYIELREQMNLTEPKVK
jgi:hypothetical protein